MTIYIDNRIDMLATEDVEGIIEKIAAQTLAYEGRSTDCEISVSIVDLDEIQQINEQFRGIDSPTDVLSFPLLTFEEGEEIGVGERNEKGEVLLGDIILCYQRAKAQAEEYGHSLSRELAFLTAHSMLHLLGYDHMEADEEKDMFQRQKEILNLAGFPRQ